MAAVLPNQKASELPKKHQRYISSKLFGATGIEIRSPLETRAVSNARGTPSAMPCSESYVKSVQTMGKTSLAGDAMTRSLKSMWGATSVSFFVIQQSSVCVLVTIYVL